MNRKFLDQLLGQLFEKTIALAIWKVFGGALSFDSPAKDWEFD